MDDLDFIHPVYLGEMVTVSSQVEFIGRTSLELGVEVHSENPRTGIRLRLSRLNMLEDALSGALMFGGKLPRTGERHHMARLRAGAAPDG